MDSRCLMEKKQHIESLLVRIKALEKEVNALREECSHEKKTIKFAQSTPTHSTGSPKWVCDTCGGVTGIPSYTEVEKWLKT